MNFVSHYVTRLEEKLAAAEQRATAAEAGAAAMRKALEYYALSSHHKSMHGPHDLGARAREVLASTDAGAELLARVKRMRAYIERIGHRPDCACDPNPQCQCGYDAALSGADAGRYTCEGCKAQINYPGLCTACRPAEIHPDALARLKAQEAGRAGAEEERPRRTLLNDDGEVRTCVGEWVEGSGGHRKHTGGCGKAAAYFVPDLWAYCEQHMPRGDFEELLEDAERERDNYKARLAEAEAKRAGFREMWESANARAVEAEREIQSREEHRKLLADERDAYQRGMGIQQKRAEEAERERDEAREQRALRLSTIKRASRALGANRELRAALDAERSEFARFKEGHEQYVAAREDDVRHLSSALDAERAKVRELEGKLAESRSRHESTQAELRRWRDDGLEAVDILHRVHPADGPVPTVVHVAHRAAHAIRDLRAKLAAHEATIRNALEALGEDIARTDDPVADLRAGIGRVLSQLAGAREQLRGWIAIGDLRAKLADEQAARRAEREAVFTAAGASDRIDSAIGIAVPVCEVVEQRNKAWASGRNVYDVLLERGNASLNPSLAEKVAETIDEARAKLAVAVKALERIWHLYGPASEAGTIARDALQCGACGGTRATQ